MKSLMRQVIEAAQYKAQFSEQRRKVQEATATLKTQDYRMLMRNKSWHR